MLELTSTRVGYLVIMIFNKWNTHGQDFPNHRPPSLLLMLISMFLQFGTPPIQGEVIYGDPVCLMYIFIILL